MQPRTGPANVAGNDNRDDEIPQPGEIIIRKPWDLPRDVAFWPKALTPRRRPRIIRMCAHCQEYPVALAEWHPAHPLFQQLCVTCRANMYRCATRITRRRGSDMRRVLDAIQDVLALEVN